MVRPLVSGLSMAVLVGTAGIVATAGTAAAVDNKSEAQCQAGTSLALGKFIRGKSKCIDGCYKNAYANSVAPDCAPPYEDPLLACVTGQETQATGEMGSGCTTDCPECYAGGDCPADATARVADAETHVDALAAESFCDDSASGDGLTLSEHKCQRTVNKVLAHFAATKLKCYSKCRKGEISGKVTAGSCAVPATDPKTAECIDKAETKAAFLIDKKCDQDVNPSADAPECVPYDTRTGATWVASEEAAVDAIVPSLFCDDPAPTTTTTTAEPTTTTTIP